MSYAARWYHRPWRKPGERDRIWQILCVSLHGSEQEAERLLLKRKRENVGTVDWSMSRCLPTDVDYPH